MHEGDNMSQIIWAYHWYMKLSIWKSIYVIHQNHRIEKKLHDYFSKCRKITWQNGTPIIVKTWSKVGMLGNFKQRNWLYEKSTAHILKGEMLDVFTLRLITCKDVYYILFQSYWFRGPH